MNRRLPGFAGAKPRAAHVRGTAIWCDAARAGGVSFVSRADAPLGRGKAERVVATEETAALCRRLGRPLADPLLPRTGRPFALGRLRLELLPSGRSAGAAQLLVELTGWRGLYAGSVWPRGGPGAPKLQVRPCDELVVDGPSDGVADDDARISERLACVAAEDGRVHTNDLAVLGLLRARHVVRLTGAWRRLQSEKVQQDVAALKVDATAGTLRVVAGRRAADDEACLALDAAPRLDELVGFVRDTGATRVWVRPSSEGAGGQRGADALVSALLTYQIDAATFGPPEQLSLFGSARSTVPRNDA